MTRLPGLRPNELDDDQRRLYDAIAGGDRAKDASFPLTDDDGALIGPFNPLLYSPTVGDAVQRLGGALRFNCGLGAAVREMAILAVATHHHCEFERWAHERIALRVGLSMGQVAALRDGSRPDFDSDEFNAAYDLIVATLSGITPDGHMYDAAVQQLGTEGIFELVAVVGYYAMLAQMMTVFKIGVPEDPAATPTG
jgi:4-carboxymuconolactone decarboxylase